MNIPIKYPKIVDIKLVFSQCNIRILLKLFMEISYGTFWANKDRIMFHE